MGLEDQLVFHEWKSSYTGLVTQTGLIQTCGVQMRAVKASHRSVTKNCIFLAIRMYLLVIPSYVKACWKLAPHRTVNISDSPKSTLVF